MRIVQQVIFTPGPVEAERFVLRQRNCIGFEATHILRDHYDGEDAYVLRYVLPQATAIANRFSGIRTPE